MPWLGSSVSRPITAVSRYQIRFSGHYADWGIAHYFSPQWQGDYNMAFFNSAITVLQTLVVALGAGLGIWGAINLLEGYGNDNPGANAHGR